MNVYEWLESPDMREYLEGIHYEFTLPEAFYVIQENQQRALEVKIAAREELLAAMPDCLFSGETESGKKIVIESFHKSVREFIGQQRELLEVVCRKDETGVYVVIMSGVPKKSRGLRFRDFWKQTGRNLREMALCV